MYLLFSDLYVLFWIPYEIKNVASLHDTWPAPAHAGMLISAAGQLELVEANVPNLGYRATPAVPEQGGKACEKPPRSDLRRSRLDPCSSPPEVVVRGAPLRAVSRYDKPRSTTYGSLSITGYRLGEG
jgi:hypothetical protein